LASIVTFAHAKPVRNAPISLFSWIYHLMPIGAARRDTRAESKADFVHHRSGALSAASVGRSTYDFLSHPGPKHNDS
jgi:hypothetical protein